MFTDGLVDTARVVAPGGSVDPDTRKWTDAGAELVAAMPCRVVRRSARSTIRDAGANVVLVDHDVLYPAEVDGTPVGRLAAGTVLELTDGRTVRLTDPAEARRRTTPDVHHWTAPALQVGT